MNDPFQKQQICSIMLNLEQVVQWGECPSTAQEFDAPRQASSLV